MLLNSFDLSIILVNITLVVNLLFHIVLFDFLCGLKAVHYRHVEVHYDHVEELVYCFLEALQTVCGAKYVLFGQLEFSQKHSFEGHESHNFVVDQEYLKILLVDLRLTLGCRHFHLLFLLFFKHQNFTVGIGLVDLRLVEEAVHRHRG